MHSSDCLTISRGRGNQVSLMNESISIITNLYMANNYNARLFYATQNCQLHRRDMLANKMKTILLARALYNMMHQKFFKCICSLYHIFADSTVLQFIIRLDVLAATKILLHSSSITMCVCVVVVHRSWRCESSTHKICCIHPLVRCPIVAIHAVSNDYHIMETVCMCRRNTE